MTDDLERRLADTLRSRAATVSARPDAWERLEAATQTRSTTANVTSLTAARDRRLMVAAPAALVGLAAALAIAFGVGHRPPRPKEMAASAPPIQRSADAGGATAAPSAAGGPVGPVAPGGGAGGTAGPALAAPVAGALPSTASRPPGRGAGTGFHPQSVTFVSATDGWVLGSAPCATQTCPLALVRTRDGGRTWAAVTSPGDGVSTVRFADATNGWAFGPGLRATHDGGATWGDVALPGVSPGAQVSSLEAGAGFVHAAVVDVGGTGPEVRVETSPVGTDTWRIAAVRVPAGAGPVPHAQVVLHGDRGWLMVVNRTVAGGARLTGGTWQSWSPPCVDAVGPGVLAAATDTDLVAACDTGAWGGTRRAEDAVVSHDGGDTFVRSPGAVPVTAANFIATGSSGHAVVSGPAADGGAVLVDTEDGGATWTTVFRQAGGGSWLDLGFTTATQGVAIESVTSGGTIMLLSHDGGHSWQPVTFTGAPG
ncbi:MAG: hypothetical protein NVSMB16_13020 [Acidimicrobiales bacterium]